MTPEEKIAILYLAGIFQGFILGFYVCYTHWVIGGDQSTAKVMKGWVEYWKKKYHGNF
jgi:disulfide bond formation protein DsbB